MIVARRGPTRDTWPGPYGCIGVLAKYQTSGSWRPSAVRALFSAPTLRPMTPPLTPHPLATLAFFCSSEAPSQSQLRALHSPGMCSPIFLLGSHSVLISAQLTHPQREFPADPTKILTAHYVPTQHGSISHSLKWYYIHLFSITVP